MPDQPDLAAEFLSEALREIAQEERERANAQRTREAATSIALRSDQMPYTPPWSNVPLAHVRRMTRLNPATRVDFSFPTVYEENRAEKIKDLAAANELKVISHRRLSELISNELALDQYDYDVELQQIAAEAQSPLLKPPDDPAALGGGATLYDAINKRNALGKEMPGMEVPPGVMPPGAGGPPVPGGGGPVGNIAMRPQGPTGAGRSALHGPCADSFRRGQGGRPGLTE